MFVLLQGNFMHSLVVFHCELQDDLLICFTHASGKQILECLY